MNSKTKTKFFVTFIKTIPSLRKDVEPHKKKMVIPIFAEDEQDASQIMNVLYQKEVEIQEIKKAE